MLKTEPTLICDHCYEQINLFQLTTFVFHGAYGGVEDDDPILNPDTILEIHYHNKCYPDAVMDATWGEANVHTDV